MIFCISLSSQAEAKLKEKAAAQGKDPIAYASELVEAAVTRPGLQDLLAVSEAEFGSTGMTADEMMNFGRELLRKVRDEKAPTP